MIGRAGLIVGLAWGWHVSGSSTWPRLLWVSLTLALAAGLLAVGRVGAPPDRASDGAARRQGLVPPWTWSAERLVGLAILDLGLAVGTAVTFEPVRLAVLPPAWAMSLKRGRSPGR